MYYVLCWNKLSWIWILNIIPVLFIIYYSSTHFYFICSHQLTFFTLDACWYADFIFILLFFISFYFRSVWHPFGCFLRLASLILLYSVLPSLYTLSSLCTHNLAHSAVYTRSQSIMHRKCKDGKCLLGSQHWRLKKCFLLCKRMAIVLNIQGHTNWLTTRTTCMSSSWLTTRTIYCQADLLHGPYLVKLT